MSVCRSAGSKEGGGWETSPSETREPVSGKKVCGDWERRPASSTEERKPALGGQKPWKVTKAGKKNPLWRGRDRETNNNGRRREMFPFNLRGGRPVLLQKEKGKSLSLRGRTQGVPLKEKVLWERRGGGIFSFRGDSSTNRLRQAASQKERGENLSLSQKRSEHKERGGYHLPWGEKKKTIPQAAERGGKGGIAIALRETPSRNSLSPFYSS